MARSTAKSDRPTSTSSTKPKFVIKRQALSSNAGPKPKRARIAEETGRKSKLASTPLTKRPSLKAEGKRKETVQKVQPPKPKKSTKSTINQPVADPGPSALPKAFKVIAGSYEKLLYGLQGSVTLSDASEATTPGSSNNTGLNFHLKPQFIFPAHVSCVKAVAASPGGGKWLATGSAEEIIKVWDLRRRKEIGGLMHHAGSLTHLSFPSRTHLLSASEDGTLALFHARDWSVLRALRGHKGRVNGVAVHPSGKVALSVGRDRTLRMWDLMRGKSSASIKLYKEGEVVRWNASGSLFVVAAQSTLDVYSTDMTLLHAITHPARIHDVTFTSHPHDPSTTVLLVAAENKKVAAYSTPLTSSIAGEGPSDTEAGDDTAPSSPQPPQILAEFTGHENRVKALSTLTVALPTSSTQPRESTTIMSTISSDGKIFVYDLFALPSVSPGEPAAEAPQILPVAEYDTAGTRLTCVSLAEDEVPVGAAAGKKRKRVDADASGDESVEESAEEDEPGWDAQVEEEEEDEAELEGEEEEEEED